MEEARKQLAAAAAAKRAKLEERLSTSADTSAVHETQVDQLQQENQHLKDTLEQYKKEREETNQRIAALESSNKENENKVTSQAVQFINMFMDIRVWQMLIIKIQYCRFLAWSCFIKTFRKK